MRKELLRSVNEGRIDNLREILPAGFNPGQRSLTEKQWEISAELMKAGATIKNKIAQHQLRWMRQNGLGVELSYAMALTWYREAAEQGNTFAQNQLGWMHEKGLVVEQNYAEARIWYGKAADQGHADAQNQLGYMHQKGKGVEQNDAEALTWYRKAADQGHAFAQNQLGWMHEKGLVVEQNYAEALNWYRKAADQSHAFAQNQLGWMHEKGLGVEQNYAEALIWYRKAADQSHALPIRLAHVNGGRLKIVVCARQFMNMMEIQQSSEQSNTENDLTDRKLIKFMPCTFLKNTILERGYGDIASGVKALQLLQHENPEAEISFIVEHFAETENELRRIDAVQHKSSFNQ